MRRINYKRVFILIVLAAVVTFLSISFLAATYAYYSNLPRVYTSDDSSGEIARVGMRINLLFDRLDPDKVGSVSLTYPDGTEEGMTVAYDSTAQWGTAANPYIISKPRHMMNLYALQKSGYFYEKYISNNFTNGEYNGGTSMPYFRVCEVDGKPAAVNGVKSDGSNVKINPIGTDEYPFIGRIAGAFADGTATLNGKTSTSSILANFLVEVTDETDVGLFGKIDYLGDSSSTQTDAQGNVTFAGTISSVTDLLLYDIKIVSHQSTFIERLANHMFADGIPNKNIEYDEDHHVGILAGHIEYSEITNISVYYSSNDIIAIDVDQEGANYYSDSGIIGFVYNLNPEVKGSSVGTNTGTTLAGTVDGGGDEWGGSIDMMTLHTRLQNVLSRVRRTQATYTSSETLTITMKIENGVEVEDTRVTSNQVTSVIPNYTHATDGTRYPKVYVADDPANGSFSYGDYNVYTSNTTTGNTAQYDLFHGKNTDYSPLTLTTYTIHANKESGYLISSGNTSNYMNAAINNNDVTSITNGTGSASATVWEIDGSGYINARLESSTSIDKYYLKSTNGSLSLVTSTSQATAFTRTNTGTNTSELTYTTTNAGLTITWYLVYDGGWKCVPYSTSYTFTNNTYYLNIDEDKLSADTTSTTQWGVTNGYIYTAVDGILYFLYYNASTKAFELSTTNKTQFDISNNQMKFTSGGTTWYIVYNNATGNWDIVKDLNPVVIYTGTNYLSADGDAVIYNGTSATATRWTFNGTSGTISTVINGTEYFLYGTTSLSLSATNSTTWTFNNNQFYYTNSGNTYYLSYVQGNWTVARSASDLAGTYIKIGGQYLKVTRSGTTNTFSFVDDMASATKWTQNTNNLATTISGTTYYLGYTNGNALTLQTNTNTNTRLLRYNGGTIRGYRNGDNQNIYLINNNGTPAISTTTVNETTTGYYIKDANNNYYLNNDSSTYTVTASATPTTIWIWNGTYFANSDNGNRRLEYYSNGYNVIAYSQTSGYYTLDSSNRLVSGGTRYITYNNGWTSGNESNAHTFELEEVEGTTSIRSTTAEIVSITAGDVNQTVYKENRTVSTTMNNSTSSKTTNNTLTSSEREVKEKTVTTEKGGYDTYFPLLAEETSPFEVNPKNTGYIVGGTHTDYQKVSGDVRVSSYYTINYLSRSLGQNTDKSNNTSYSDAKLEVLTRTYKSNGFKRVTDEYNYNHSSVTTKLSNYSAMTVEALGLVKYNSARTQLSGVFAKDDERVYGMHFMDAPISMNELIVAPKVVVNNNTYYNYQMPESSIDFKLKTKGFINFFAGTYYANSGKENNSFFSLHEIKRNSVTQEITSIKHIEKIYGNPSKDTLPYIYKYFNEAEPTLPAGKDYIEMFNASWIENPGNGSDIEWYTMYYFEIPVNAGEYALGSVDGKYGAYLCYLDIGASAASHQSVLGSIDLVYDNGGSKIVTVKDVSDTETTNSYYIPSLVVIYTRNTDKDGGSFVKINNFTIKTRRTRGSEEAKGTVTTTLAGTDNAHLQVTTTSKGGDELVTTGGYVSG